MNWLHVDNGVVTASDESFPLKLETDLKDTLKIKWKQSPDSIVGLNVIRDDNGFVLQQCDLTNQLLKAEWDGITTTASPLLANFNAVTDPSGDESQSAKFPSVIGTLSY